MAAPCRIQLLGGATVEVDARAIPAHAWRSDDALNLVKVLALDPSLRATRADIVSRLWPTASPREADAALRQAVKHACKAMGDGRAVTIEGDRVRLWPHGELTVDAHTFAARAKHARRDEERAAAIELYRGDLLPQDVGVWWTEPLRTRLRLMYLELLRDPSGPTPPWIDLRNPAAVPAP